MLRIQSYDVPVIPEKLAARGSVSHGNPVDGSLDTAWVPMCTSTQSRREQLAGRCAWLRRRIVPVSWRAYIRKPIRFGSGGATARYEVPIYCGLANVCRVVAQSWAFLQHGCRRTRGLLIYSTSSSTRSCRTPKNGSYTLPDDREATFHSHENQYP